MIKKNFLIVGLGNVGTKRLDILVKEKIYHKIYIFDKKKIKVKKKNIVVLKKLNKNLLSKLNIDLAILSVNPEYAFKHGRLILESGINLLVEKPPFFKFKEYKFLYNLSLKKKKYLFIGFNFLHDPFIKAIKEDYLNKIGNLYKVEMDYLYGTSLSNLNKVGSFMDVGLHLIGITMYFLQQFKIVNINLNSFEKKYPNYDEDGTIILKKGKTIIKLNFSFINWINKFNFKAIGSKGMIDATGLAKWRYQKLNLYKRTLPSGFPKLIKSKTYKKDISFENEILYVFRKIGNKSYDEKENLKYFEIMKKSYSIFKKQKKKINYFK